MSGKRLLDVAALFKATRSVALKHAALRTRQFEAYKRTSSLVKAVADQTDRIILTAKAASALRGRLQDSGKDYSTQASSGGPSEQAPQVPSRESVQTPEGAPIKKHGLQQDHFYERSEQNTTAQPPPNDDIGVQQESAKRYPLPDGSIPPIESHFDTPTQDGGSYAQLPRTDPVKDPLTQNTNQPQGKIEPVSSGQSSIPDPSKENTLPSPEDARKLQRQAENQVPSQAAEPPPASASDVNATRDNQGETAELGLGQEQDVFYTPSPKASRVLSALPRVKLPKNTVNEQHSIDRVPDERINQDVFYSSHSHGQEQAVPEQQAIPQQDKPSEDMYSELFHSPKVAMLLKGGPKPADSSKVLNLEGVKETPVKYDRSTPAGDTESFNIRATATSEKNGSKARASPRCSTPSESSQEDDIQTLAADIAKDTTQPQIGSQSVSQQRIATTPHSTDGLTAIFYRRR